MASINSNYLNLKESYLFSEIAKRISAYTAEHKDAKVIRLGIGDVTEPLSDAVIAALHSAVDDMAKKESFKGYGPEQGYDFLRELILEHEYTARGVALSSDEIFVSDGSKSDTGNIGDIFSADNVVAITDPVYPVYLDTSIMAGRTVKILASTEENGFSPEPPDFKADLVFLCSPNNPTGSVFTRESLEKWVAYARKNDAVIFFDGAYEGFITEEGIPHSIYEIDGAKECAIEFRSFSKKAGFTGTRCAYTVVPKALMGTDKNGQPVSLNKLWNRRHTTKFNGTPYIVQKGAAAIYTPEGKNQTEATISYYLENARIIRETLVSLGFTVFGGKNAPYIWLKCPNGLSSWDFFDLLLNELNIVGTPGSGFGENGEGYFRLTAFGSREATLEAMDRMKNHFGK